MSNKAIFDKARFAVQQSVSQAFFAVAGNIAGKVQTDMDRAAKQLFGEISAALGAEEPPGFLGTSWNPLVEKWRDEKKSFNDNRFHVGKTGALSRAIAAKKGKFVYGTPLVEMENFTDGRFKKTSGKLRIPQGVRIIDPGVKGGVRRGGQFASEVASLRVRIYATMFPDITDKNGDISKTGKHGDIYKVFKAKSVKHGLYNADHGRTGSILPSKRPLLAPFLRYYTTTKTDRILRKVTGG